MDVRELRWDDDDAADDGLTFISSSSNDETIRTNRYKGCCVCGFMQEVICE